MNAELLLAHYDRISDAPDAIPRLRKFILDLAVRGKLVSQNSSDEPASSIPERIRAERMKRKGAKRKDGHTEPANDDVAQAPFELPSGWTWSHFLDLGAFGRGKSKHRPRNDASLFRNGTHFLIQTGDVARSGGLITTYTNKYNEVGLAQSMEWPKGTLCITIAANIADSGILTFDACFPDSVVGFVPDPIFPNAKFFEYFVRTAKANLLEFAPATAQKNINLEILNAVLIPLPPLAEQHRIVAKIDELMALCDRLEASQREQETRREQLTASAHHHLKNSDNAEELHTRAQFLVGNLPRLTKRPDQIKQLRQTILNLAVRGRLAPPEQTDENAHAILAGVRIAREKLVANGRMKPIGKLVTTGDENRFDFSIPLGWLFCFVDDLALKVTDGEHATPERSQSGHYLLSARNVTNSGIDVSDVDFVSKAEFERIRKRCDPDKNDVLISCSGSVGRVAVVDQDNAYAMVRSAALIKLDSSLINSYYVALALRSDPAQEQVVVYSKSTAQANLFIGAIRKLRIPLPPLAEQHRIVAKVDELTALCDKLEANLITAQTETSRLLESVLHAALNGEHRRIDQG
jgi:type I restriction enzyme S subunit